MREKSIDDVGGRITQYTPVVLGGARGGPDVPTLRTDRYWVQPVVTFVVLTSFVAYASWAAFVNKNYFVGAGITAT